LFHIDFKNLFGRGGTYLLSFGVKWICPGLTRREQVVRDASSI
jgi:hypothetical protein